EQLDGRTLSRLTRARHAALDEVRAARRSPFRRWVPATGIAAAAAAVVMLAPGGRQSQPAVSTESSLLDDFEIVADADNIDMLQDVEFYSWMPDDALDTTTGGTGS